jgi:hypothetical protein
VIPVDTVRDISPPSFMWGKLLRAIRHEQVIPIIGPELLPYHVSLAPALASEMRVSPANAELGIGAVADAAGGSGDAATEALSVLLQGYTRRTPTALADLASIDEFRLIFTTDYISLVEQAMFESGKRCKTRGFALRRRADSVQVYPDGEERCVYHLLGHLERFGAIALPRAKQLEYLYSLTTGRTNLLGVLSESKNLLFLGCNFPEWIAGLFTRMLLGKPLYESRESLEVVACSGHEARGCGSAFTAFLRDNRVEIYPGDAASFVSELARRYHASAQADAWPSYGSMSGTDPNGSNAFGWEGAAQHDTEPGPTPRSEPGYTVTAGRPRALRGHAFISYCHADLQAAKTLAEELTQRGVNVWFDERDVPPGALVNDAIRLAIEDDSSAFIAVVSRKVFQAQKAFFLFEWNCAARAQRSFAPGVPFAFPVVVDEQSVSEAVTGLRSFFPPWAESNVEPCRDGYVTDELVAALKNARKRFERRRVHDTRPQ